MFEFSGVIVDGSVVLGAADVGSLWQLQAGEEVYSQEGGKLELVLVVTEYLLVVDVVGTEVEDQRFEVHNFWVDQTLY